MIRNFIILFFISALLTTSNIHTSAQEKKYIDVNPDSLVDFAKQFIGTPYVWGGCEPGGFDCSGFVYYVFCHFGINTTKNSYEFPQYGVPVSIDSCKTGDLILFTHDQSKDKTIGHVGIIISKEGEPIEFIQSSSAKKHNGVVVSEFDPAYEKRFVEIIRLTE